MIQPQLKQIGKVEASWKSHWDLFLALGILLTLLVIEYGFNLEIPILPCWQSTF
jgi:Cd2+/Zn2+-exporting ATPase